MPLSGVTKFRAVLVESVALWFRVTISPGGVTFLFSMIRGGSVIMVGYDQTMQFICA